MGVVYKLTPEISSFIIEQKRNDLRISCQKLAGMVSVKFGQQVSKSSVHELLKQAHVIVPRTHKPKEKFQIPLEKKAQISKSLEPFVIKSTVEIDTKPFIKEQSDSNKEVTLVDDKLPTVIDTPLPLEQIETFPSGGNVFLKSAWWDLSLKPIMGINNFDEIDSINNNYLRVEWEYLIQRAQGIRIELQDNNTFFIDCRFQKLSAEIATQAYLSAAVERVACEIPDFLLNNIKPLVIREYGLADFTTTGYDFISALENLPGKNFKKVSLLGVNNQGLSEFNLPLAHKRQFILGVSSDCKEFQWAVDVPEKELIWKTPLKDKANKDVSLRVIRNENMLLITNMRLVSYEEIKQIYTQRHPLNTFILSSVNIDLKETIIDQGQWIKNRLKERAMMFFPSGFSPFTLEEILLLPGFEERKKKVLEVRLLCAENFGYVQEIKMAANNVNNLNIQDYTGKKVEIHIESDCRKKAVF
ncbi:MAG: helix-turn-helix domain-containing protein [Candidatus Omnitrophota bacterium]